MVFWERLYYNVGVSEVGHTSQRKHHSLKQQIFPLKRKSWEFCKKTIDNFSYPKYNGLVMQLGISRKVFQKEKKESA